MTRLPALSVLPFTDDVSKTEYEQAHTAAQKFAGTVPLVRVVIPDPTPVRPQREHEQIEDILRRGQLRPSHESDNSHAVAADLGVGRRLYLHAGRTHPDYGKMVFVFRRSPQTVAVDATPFGLGGLCCSQTGRWHMIGSCTAPVAHDPKEEQKAFVQASLWGADWRDQAAQFVAAYFGANLSDYFAPDDNGKPRRADPAEIYTDVGSRDWRSWTVEVRLDGEINLFEEVANGNLLCWSIDEHLEARLEEEISRTGAQFPFWERLVRDAAKLRIANPGYGVQDLFRLIDMEIMKLCLR